MHDEREQGFIVLRNSSFISGVGESEIDVAIAAPPRDGQANEELLNFVGKLLDLRKSELDFDKVSFSKRFRVIIKIREQNQDPRCFSSLQAE